MIIAICCSKKFKKEERKIAKELRALGLGVYEPPLPSMAVFENTSAEQKYFILSGLTQNHFSKIRKSDAVYILNIGGYIGVAVTMEIAYAAALNKKIFFMEDDTQEIARKVLCDGIAKNAKELKQKLSELKTPDITD